MHMLQRGRQNGLRACCILTDEPLVILAANRHIPHANLVIHGRGGPSLEGACLGTCAVSVKRIFAMKA